MQQKVFPLSRGQEGNLEAEGVITLTCGEYRFPDCAEKCHLNIVSGQQISLDAVEVEGFEQVQKKPQLDTDTGVCLIP